MIKMWARLRISSLGGVKKYHNKMISIIHYAVQMKQRRDGPLRGRLKIYLLNATFTKLCYFCIDQGNSRLAYLVNVQSGHEKTLLLSAQFTLQYLKATFCL